MKSFSTFVCDVPKVAIIIALTTFSAVSQAAPLTYSWSGLLTLLNTDDDPLQIGPASIPFNVSIRADSQADDRDENDVRHAEFLQNEMTLRFAGRELTTPLGDALFEFTDDVGGVSDFISIDNEFQLSGFTFHFLTVAGLPISTFAFSQLKEVPPVFSPAFTNLDSINLQSGYQIWTPSGTVVTVVPEPSAWLVAAAGCAGSFVAWRVRGRSQDYRPIPKLGRAG
jgi:hypothetical protein